MRLTKANIAGLASSLQQAELKSILAGVWPPLKPLPVFRYETVAYRATIDFDKKRGEWVCRKISLPSNTIQELRGGLREITMALPHGEAETSTADEEQQEQELDKDANRRLQAIREWKEHYENGALYFELRDRLSEIQQTEMDDSLRLSLTARQLQFNPKNVAYVFDVLSTAGGRFATLIEFAKRKKTKQETEPQVQEERAVPEAEGEPEPAIAQDDPSVKIREPDPVPSNQLTRDEEGAKSCAEADVDELPAVSVKNVLSEPEQAPLAERTTLHEAPQQFEMETTECVDTDSASLVEHPYEEEHHQIAATGFAAQVQTGPVPANHGESSSRHFPAVEISAFHIAVFSALFLSATFAFTVGLTVGRGPLASRLWEAPKSMLGMEAKPPAPPDRAVESTPQIPAPAAMGANESGSSSRPSEGAPSERKPVENSRSSEYSAKAPLTNFNSSVAALSAKREVSVEHSVAIEPGTEVTRKLTPAMSAAPSLPRSTTILVTRPGRGSQPFRVSFPEKTIAATSSLAMSSQLSVVVFAEPGLRATHRSARLEAGDLVSYVLPHYPRPGDRNGSGETIKVRATIGPLGQVREVKFVSGSSSLLPATKAAIRQWRYRPTLMDKRPVQAQQDVTIAFRPPQYTSQVSTPHPSHN